jgi:hypothetical protein
MTDCPRLAKCGFFKKHGVASSLACQGFVLGYCRGPRQVQCQRLEHLRKHGSPPPDDMMPSGQMLAP